MMYCFACGFSRTIPLPCQSFPKQSTVNFTIPPTHPRIVAAKAANGRLGKDLVMAADRCTFTTPLPFTFCTHASSQLEITCALRLTD
jgi:hypothetical protein